MTEAKIKYTAETITCYPINMESLNNMVNEFFHKDNPNLTTEYRVLGSHALIKEPSLAVIDKDFVGGDVATNTTWCVFEIETKPDGTKVVHYVPAHEISIPLTWLEPHLEAPISLAEFTKERRGHNARIRTNEYEWMRFFNKEG